MRYFNLQIKALRKPELLERLLQVTRYRCFQLNSMNVTINDEKHLYRITMNVGAVAPIERLQLQLNKIIDVIEITVFQDSEEKNTVS
ncbi:MAG: acetolactate synthase 2 small subunit [Parashewanella sp.]